MKLCLLCGRYRINTNEAIKEDIEIAWEVLEVARMDLVTAL